MNESWTGIPFDDAYEFWHYASNSTCERLDKIINYLLKPYDVGITRGMGKLSQIFTISLEYLKKHKFLRAYLFGTVCSECSMRHATHIFDKLNAEEKKVLLLRQHLLFHVLHESQSIIITFCVLAACELWRTLIDRERKLLLDEIRLRLLDSTKNPNSSRPNYLYTAIACCSFDIEARIIACVCVCLFWWRYDFHIKRNAVRLEYFILSHVLSMVRHCWIWYDRCLATLGQQKMDVAHWYE